ncbi:MAG: ATP-binding protein [Promethearchaeia archaeon]
MSKLVIKKIILKNWGPYYGEHTIEFSTNPNQNVTYILGKNGTGKTKLFQAINWVLFLDSNYNYISKINTEARSYAENNNIKCETFVEIFFNIIDDVLNAQKEYHIKRFLQYDKKIDDPSFFGSFTEYASNEPKIITEKDFKQIINEYIPKGPREFYFLDGEQLVSLFKINIEVIKSLTINQSIVPFIEKMIEGLKLRKKEIIKKMKTLGKKDENLKKLTENLENNNNILNNLQEEKDSLINDKEKYNKKKFEYEKILIGTGIQPKQKDELDLLRKEIANKKEREIEIKKELESILKNNAVHILLEDIYNWCIDDLKKKKKEGIIPSYIDDKVIDEIKQMEKCICGNKITEVELNNLEEFKKSIPKGIINTAVIEFRAWLENIIEKIQINKEKFKELYNIQKELRYEINQLEKEKLILEKSISDLFYEAIEKIRSLEKRINEITIQIREKDNEINDINKEIKIIKGSIKKITTELKKTIEGKKLSEEIAELNKEGDLIDYFEEILIKIKEDTINYIREYIELKTSEKFLKFIWNPQEWKGIKIDSDWNFFGIQNNEQKIEAPDLSKGQRHVLAISYLSSLPLVTTINLPFIFDSPFGGISKEPVKNIGKFLPDILKGSQIVLFVTDTEHDSVFPFIQNKIGIKYTIQYDNNRAKFIKELIK